jgi:hypothetical protein
MIKKRLVQWYADTRCRHSTARRYEIFFKLSKRMGIEIGYK